MGYSRGTRREGGGSALPSASTAVEARPAPARTRSPRSWVRLFAGVGILGLLVWRVETGPFLHGIQSVDAAALAAALAIGVVITIGCAWRWSLIASGLGVRLPLRQAVAAYY